MPKIKVKQDSAHRQMEGHTQGRYQMYYLPCYVVDKCDTTRLHIAPLYKIDQ